MADGRAGVETRVFEHHKTVFLIYLSVFLLVLSLRVFKARAVINHLRNFQCWKIVN